MKMNRKEVIVEGMMFLLSVICGVCAIGMGVGLHSKWIYEPTIIIRTFETIIFINSGILLCIWSWIRLVKKYGAYIREKGN